MAIQPKGLGSGSALVGGTGTQAVSPDVSIRVTDEMKRDVLITERSVNITFLWRIPVNGFVVGTPSIAFYEEGNVPPADGALTDFMGAEGSRSYTANLNLPEGRGQAVITIHINVAHDVNDENNRGPLVPRSLFIFYDTVRAATVPGVEISFPFHTPLSKRFVGERILTRFSFTENVRRFDLDDDVTLSDEDASIGSLTGGPRVYDAITELPANERGMLTIAVKEDSVRGVSTTGPPGEVSVVLLYDSRPTQNRSITPGAGIPTPVLVHKDVNDFADGIYNGVMETHIVGDKIYMVNQLMHAVGSSPNDFPNEGRMAFGELAVYDLTASSYSVLKTYEYITTAARSLTTHKGELNFFEGSHYADAYNDNIDFIVKRDDDGNSFRQLQYTWKADAGFVRKVVGSAIEEVGRWRSAFRNPDDDAALRDIHYGTHIGTASPMVSGPSDTGETSVLNMVSGYGDLDNILDINDPVSLYENWQWLQVGTTLNPRFDIVNTNDKTGWAVLEEFVVSTNSSIGFDVNKFFFRSANAPEGPILEEDADYTLDINANTLLQPIDDLNFVNAEVIFFNDVRVQYGEQVALAVDKDSPHPESILRVNTLLSDQQVDWANWLANQYLERFSTMRQMINLELIEHHDIEVGDIAFVKAEHRAHLNQACQVLDVDHDLDARTTTLVLIMID